MEEDVWRDLTLSSLHHHQRHRNPAFVPPVSEMTLQEFLPYPSTKNVEPETPMNPSTSSISYPKRKKDCDIVTSEWEKIKLMKNRESAARSRARKQAYTHKLELKAAHLEKENAKLRQEVEKLCADGVGDADVKKKRKLSRTLTAPF